MIMKNKILFASLVFIAILGLSLFLTLTFKSKPIIENITPLPEKVNQDLIIPVDSREVDCIKNNNCKG